MSSAWGSTSSYGEQFTPVFNTSSSSIPPIESFDLSSWLATNVYSISYMWFLILVCIVVIVIAILVSLVTGGVSEGEHVDQRLLHPVIRKCCYKSTDNYQHYIKGTSTKDTEL